MGIYTIAGVLIAAALLAVVLRQYKAEYAVLVGISAAVFVMIAVLPQISNVISFIKTAAGAAPVLNERLSPLIKAVGVAVITELAADACRDAQENGMASKVELAGKVAILVLAIPLAKELLNLAASLMR